MDFSFSCSSDCGPALAAANVLLSHEGTAKLTDVGLSKALGTDRTHLSEQQGYTFAWAAPEVGCSAPEWHALCANSPT